MYKVNWKLKPARTSPYDGTESRDTTRAGNRSGSSNGFLTV